MDDDLRKRLLAIEVLLQEPDDLTDPLEAELYLLRDKLQALALSSPAPEPRPAADQT
jgi:hypothetical protein